MTAVSYDFDIEQGATLIRPFRWKAADGTPIDMTGCTARMQFRPSIASKSILLSANTENGGIELDEAGVLAPIQY